MKLKLLLLLIGALVISSKSEPLRSEKQNFDLHNSPQDGSASYIGSYYPSSEGISSTFHNQGTVPKNDHEPVNSNYGSRNFFSNYRSDQGLTSDLINSDYGSRGSVSSFGPVPKPGNYNYGTQGSFPSYRPNQGPINGQDPHFGFQDNAPTSGSNYPRESTPGPRNLQDGSRAASGLGLNQGIPTSSENSNYGAQGSFPGYRYNQGPINGQNFHSGSYVPTSESNFPGESSRELRYPQDGSQDSSPGFGFNQGPLTRSDNSNYGSRGSFPGLSSNQGPISEQNFHHGSQYDAPTFGQNYPTGRTRSRNLPYDSQASSPSFGLNRGPLTEPENSNDRSQSSFPTSRPSYNSEPTLQPENSNDGFGSNQGPVARPSNFHDGSQGSFSNLRPTHYYDRTSLDFNGVSQRRLPNQEFSGGGSNVWGSGLHGSRNSPSGSRSSWWSSTRSSNTYDGFENSSPRFGSDMSFAQNVPLVWEVETLEDYDPNAVEKNAELFDPYRGRNHWKLRPFETSTVSHTDPRIKNVYLVFSGATFDDRKPTFHTTINGENAIKYSFRQVVSPTIDDIVLTYNTNTQDAPIYIKPDPYKLVTSYIHNGKLRIIFHVCRVYL